MAPEWQRIFKDESDENSNDSNILEGTGLRFPNNKDIVNICKLADIQYKEQLALHIKMTKIESRRKRARRTLTDFYRRILESEDCEIAGLTIKADNVIKLDEIINGFKYLDDTKKHNLIIAYQSANNTRKLYQQAQKQKHIKIDYNEIVMKFEALELSIEDRKVFENAGKR